MLTCTPRCGSNSTLAASRFKPSTLGARSEHPRYLSLAQLCTAAVILSSPLFGWMIDQAGYESVFAVVTVLILLGGALTFTLEEPRKR